VGAKFYYSLLEKICKF